MPFSLGDQDDGTLVGLRELLRKAAEQKTQQMPVDVSSGTASGYANGGSVMPQKQDKPYTGVQPTKKPDLNAVQQALNDIAKKDTRMTFHVPTPEGTTAPGVMVGHRFAHGGVVPQPVDMGSIPPPAAPMAPPTPPPLGALSSAINQTPDTDYSFFNNGLSSDDRAALEQKLIAQQNSPGQMIAQGAAGLGDAISNSFGGKNTTFQKDVMANNELQQKKQLEGIDTHRAQKMQDMNANMEMQANDPKSPLSMSMRKIAQSQGVPVPSGMPASMMMKVLGPLGELAMKQATLEQQRQLQQQTIDVAKAGQKTKEEEVGFQQDKEAATHWLLDPKGAAAARSRLAQGSAPQTNGFAIGQQVKHPSGAIVTRTK